MIYPILVYETYFVRNFYHKICGNSMRKWMPFVEDFRHTIYDTLRGGVTVENIVVSGEVNTTQYRYILLQIAFESFLIFG